MTASGSEFMKMRIGISDGKIKKIKDEKERPHTDVDPKDVPWVEKNGTLIARIYRCKFNPTCTVIITADGRALKICR